MPVLAPFSFDIFLFELLSPLVAGGSALLVSLDGGPDLGLLAGVLAAGDPPARGAGADAADRRAGAR